MTTASTPAIQTSGTTKPQTSLFAAKTGLDFGGAVTLVSIFIIVVIQLVAAVAATDWAISTLLGLPQWATISLAAITAIPTMYAGYLVAKLAYKAESELLH
jgi:hypothetical protein